jgi:two-component sensor histidine kinase
VPVKTQLRPFIGRRAASLVTEGPDVLLPNQAVMKLSLVLHELASNASKHGAFSVNEGMVQLSWRLAGSVLVFVWKERGGPRLSGPPDRKGFGTQVIKRGTKRVEKVFRPDGLVCEFEVPLS